MFIINDAQHTVTKKTIYMSVYWHRVCFRQPRSITTTICTATAGWIATLWRSTVCNLNGNGIIDNGAELFGDNTKLADYSFAKHGYADLTELDSNGDGIVSKRRVGTCCPRVSYFKAAWNRMGINAYPTSQKTSAVCMCRVRTFGRQTRGFIFSSWVGMLKKSTKH